MIKRKRRTFLLATPIFLIAVLALIVGLRELARTCRKHKPWADYSPGSPSDRESAENSISRGGNADSRNRLSMTHLIFYRIRAL